MHKLLTESKVRFGRTLRFVRAKVAKARTWTVIAAISSAIAASAALISVSLAVSELRQQRLSRRPYLTIRFPQLEQYEIKGLKEQFLHFKLTIENVGIRPAQKRSVKLIIVDNVLDLPPLDVMEFNSANDLPPNVPWTVIGPDVSFPGPEVPPRFFVVATTYSDTISSGTFKQIFYLKWPGVHNGVANQDINDASDEERATIILRLRPLLTKYL